MKTAEEITKLIEQAQGTEQYHSFAPYAKYPRITDGVKAVADAAECY